MTGVSGRIVKPAARGRPSADDHRLVSISSETAPDPARMVLAAAAAAAAHFLPPGARRPRTGPGRLPRRLPRFPRDERRRAGRRRRGVAARVPRARARGERARAVHADGSRHDRQARGGASVRRGQEVRRGARQGQGARGPEGVRAAHRALEVPPGQALLSHHGEISAGEVNFGGRATARADSSSAAWRCSPEATHPARRRSSWSSARPRRSRRRRSGESWQAIALGDGEGGARGPLCPQAGRRRRAFRRRGGICEHGRPRPTIPRKRRRASACA